MLMEQAEHLMAMSDSGHSDTAQRALLVPMAADLDY
jgi:hypothetical protein